MMSEFRKLLRREFGARAVGHSPAGRITVDRLQAVDPRPRGFGAPQAAIALAKTVSPRAGRRDAAPLRVKKPSSGLAGAGRTCPVCQVSPASAKPMC
jgi:hypothetical protein